MFVCVFVCMFVCLYVCLLDIPAWSSLIRYTCCTWEEAEFIGRCYYRKINSVPPTLLPLQVKNTQLSYLSTIFFLSDVASNGIPNDMYLIIYL